MVKAFKVTNPGNPQDGIQQSGHPDGVTIFEIQPDLIDEPWLCIAYIDGKRYFPKRDEWDTKLKNGDCVYFMPYVGDGGLTFLIYGLFTIAAVAVSLSFTPPDVGDTPEPDPVFDLKGQKNQNRLGNPIEDCYGRVTMWPSIATRSYNQYYGNNQFQFRLFCLGQGSYDIEEIRVEDTEISNFQEVTYEIYQPGEPVTLFPDNVETEPAVTSLELYATNEVEFPGGPTGPYTANSSGTLATKLEVDITLPQGLYKLTNEGKIKDVRVTALFEYREFGTTGAWLELASFDKTLSTNTPQRFTLEKEVPEGRYEVRGQRTNSKDTSTRYISTLVWVGLRAFLKSTKDYGDVTMLAVRARATSGLNDTAGNRINVVGTRKLPIWDDIGKTLADPDDYVNRVATRSHIWAMVNILRSSYGAGLADSFIDLEFLADEAAQGLTDGIYFDWIFDRRSTVWESVKLPCFVAKSVPMLNGSRVTVVRDQPATLPTFFINPENTIENSFNLEKKLFELQDYDGLEVEYTDPDTWKPETIDCLLSGSLGLNLKKRKLQGVTDRQRAYDLGMYLWAKENYERSQVNVTTGLEGYIPTFGDLVRVGSDIPRWGFSGFIKSINGSTINLSDPVEFTEGEIHQLAIRGRSGQDLGPYTVTAGASEFQVILSGLIDPDGIYFDPDEELPYYLFGISNEVGTICRIVNLSPTQNEEVDIKAIVDDQRRFVDYGTAPAKDDPTGPPVVPDAPAVASIDVLPILDTVNFVSVVWTPTFGAVSYTLEQSLDGLEWVLVDSVLRTNYTLPVVPGTLWVRVAAVNVGIGPFVEWTGSVGDATAIPGDVGTLVVQPAFLGTSLHVNWEPAVGATSYKVEVYTGGILRCTDSSISLDYEFNIDDAIECGGLSRTIRIDVTGVNSFGESAIPATITATNPSPAKLEVFDFYIGDTDESTEYSLGWIITTDSDFAFYRVWTSTTEGFAPGAGNLYYEGLTRPVPFFNIKDVNGKTPTIYIRAAAYDIWGEEVNLSDELQINGTETTLSDGTNDLTDGTNNLTN